MGNILSRIDILGIEEEMARKETEKLELVDEGKRKDLGKVECNKEGKWFQLFALPWFQLFALPWWNFQKANLIFVFLSFLCECKFTPYLEYSLCLIYLIRFRCCCKESQQKGRCCCCIDWAEKKKQTCKRYWCAWKRGRTLSHQEK